MPPSSARLRLVVGTLLMAGGVYVGLSAALGTLAGWAEREFEAYPYFAGEDPIRLLLPTVHRASGGGTLLLGPSAIGEAFLYEELERVWGTRVRSASLSNGTIDDYYLFLTYLERAYGPDALPDRIILGMKPRVLASLPRLFGPLRTDKGEPFTISAIDRYSTRYRVQRGELGTELVAKSRSEAVAAWFRFRLTKQQPRHRTGVVSAVEYAMDPDPLKVGFQQNMPTFPEQSRTLLTRLNIATAVAFVRDAGVVPAAYAWLRAYRSAYNNLFMQPMDDAEIRDVLATADMAFDWVPRDEAAMVDMQLGRLAAFIDRHDIELVVVYLPVHPAVRAGYAPERFAEYKAAVEGSLAMATFVDLWESMPGEMFHDEVHPTYAGAVRATALLTESLGHQPRLARTRDPSGTRPSQH